MKDLQKKFGTEKLSVKTGWSLEINFETCIMTTNNKEYMISPVGEAAQELILTKGLENWVKERI